MNLALGRSKGPRAVGCTETALPASITAKNKIQETKLRNSCFYGNYKTRSSMTMYLALRNRNKSVCEVGGGDGEDISPPVKTVVVPSKERKFVLGEDAKTSSPVISCFYTCCLWVYGLGRYFIAYISCSHYGFLRKLIKNNLFSVPITEQFIFHKH